MEQGFWVTQKNVFWNMFSFFFLCYVSTREVIEILMKLKSCSPPRAVINGSWKKTSVSEHFAPCLSQSGVPSPHIAFRHGRSAGLTSRTWRSTGSRPLSFTSRCDAARLFQQSSLGFWMSICAALTGENMPLLFICLHPAHRHAVAEMLLSLHSPGITAGVAGAVCSCLHTLSRITTHEQYLFTLSSP